MSFNIIINDWVGTDQDLAARKLAKVFRLTPEKSNEILTGLMEGRPWRFEHRILDRQANTAANFLGNLGFRVDLEMANGETGVVDDITASEPGENSPRILALPLGFHGSGRDLFTLYAVNQIWTVLTLGIYHFWAKTKVRRYLYSHTSLVEDRFSYHGTGKELFRGAIRFFGLFVLYALVMVYLQMNGGPVGKTVSDLSGLVLLPIIPLLMVGAWRYRLSRTAWRGIRFSFRGDRQTALGLYLKGWLLTIVTLGFYAPFFHIQKQRFWRGHSYFGNMPFEFTGRGRDVFENFIKGAFLSVLTFGIYWFWYQAWLKRYVWDHTNIGDANFRFTATGGQWFSLKLTNVLLLVVTLGVGYPWVVARNQKFLADHLSLEGNFQLDKVIQEIMESGPMGEEALDALDVALDVA